MRPRGRPIIGGIAGFFFGLFLAVDLILFTVIKLKDITVVILPILGIVAGVLLGLFPPFRRERAMAGGYDEAPAYDEPPPPPAAE